jgi:hypothetical protein
MEVAVRREQLVADREPRVDAAVAHCEDLDADEPGEPALADPCERLSVYLPATDETYLATAVI